MELLQFSLNQRH